MPIWTPEVEVDDDLASTLIHDQFPQLQAREVRRLAIGWDNTVFAVDEAWVFRFPHRRVAVDNLERELAVLPRVEAMSELPLAIPRPEHVGRPGRGFPWLFVGYARLEGREPAEVSLDGRARDALGAALGRFLRALHTVPLQADLASILDDDPMGRADMATRVPMARGRLAELDELGLWSTPASVRDLLARALRLGRPAPTVLAHGDLHHRHLLVDDRGGATAVIDWGDVCRADPSVDLPLYWSLLAPSGRAAFREAYGPIPAEGLVRARVLALGLAATLAVYAHREGMPALERESLAGLERATVD